MSEIRMDPNIAFKLEREVNRLKAENVKLKEEQTESQYQVHGAKELQKQMKADHKTLTEEMDMAREDIAKMKTVVDATTEYRKSEDTFTRTVLDDTLSAFEKGGKKQ